MGAVIFYPQTLGYCSGCYGALDAHVSTKADYVRDDMADHGQWEAQMDYDVARRSSVKPCITAWSARLELCQEAAP